MDTGVLAGKVAIITGAAVGMGAATARVLAEAGAKGSRVGPRRSERPSNGRRHPAETFEAARSLSQSHGTRRFAASAVARSAST
jgi:NAD(P)-dependent dehydrogenase (short-subunit alcohol dehydrogenase family)